MKNIVILISGGGSNMRALVRHVQNNNWEAQNIARVAAVISNKADAQGLVFAQEQGIATRVVQHQDFADREAFDAQLQHIIDEFAPDVVFLAGFMRILTPAFTTHYAKRMFNIHPSILPNFKGLHTHAAALTAGVKVHGATVHGVTAELDHGPIVLQSAVPVLADDDEHSLAQRVLATEHLIYPQVLDWWVNGLIDWNDNGIRVRDVRTQLYISDTI
ncbi:phosphoribosylglycinamide formyltransferase [Hydromonas duriensis]|nr:phosphoribosylglycinamide formyltransferase [Hydromonas duriensis]